MPKPGPRKRVRPLVSRGRQLVLLALFGVIAACAPTRVLAQYNRYSIRETLGAGMMVSKSQVGLPLVFDRIGVLAGLQVSRAMLPWLELRTGLQMGRFYSTLDGVGGLVDATVGGLMRIDHSRLSPYVAFDGGYGMTGKFFRPFLSVQVGLDATLVGRHAIGPVLGYSQLVQWNDKYLTTDAKFIWFGISLRQRLGHAPAPTPPPVQIIRRTERVETVVYEPAEPSEDVLKLIERALPASTTRVEMLAPVLFAFNADTLEPNGVAMLHEVSRTLSTRPDIKRVEIEGYADQRGNVEYNRALSERRAKRVKTWLVEHGVDPARLTVVAHGASDFVETGKDEAAHEQNRRVIFRVVEQEVTP